MKKQAGFTLAEMTIVIVVLGILSAFFMPKFEYLIRDARIAKVERLAGSIKEAAAITHATQIAEQLAPAGSIDIDGDPATATDVITMVNRYPTADSAGVSAAMLSFAEPELFGTGPGQFEDLGNGSYNLSNTADEANCSVTYVAPATVGELPVVTIATSGCN
ncbi:MAG: type II secretion system protein [Pseudomonadota bacterium]|nr:type II secretion system protein [Pseudomonadota bacterium]